MTEMCKGKAWLTDDPLGLGGLLADAYRVAQLMAKGYFASGDLLLTILDLASKGLEVYLSQGLLEEPADYRLPFRELGLSIGLGGIVRLDAFVRQKQSLFKGFPRIAQTVATLLRLSTLIKKINEFWLDTEHQQAETWIGHRDINMVMLATTLSPEGFLRLF
jgi:hypothetical protein